MFEPMLAPGEIVSNRKLLSIFHCACEGGIRYASRTGTVVIVVNNTKTGLPNIWHGNVLDFAGRLLKDDKTLTGANKRLNEFLQEGKPVFLFEVDKPGEYRYKGAVRLAAPVRFETSDNGVFPVFPLRLED